jgi:hypothetical protein
MVSPLHSMQYSHESDFFTQHIGIGKVTGMLSVTSPKPKQLLESLVTMANSRRYIYVFYIYLRIHIIWCSCRIIVTWRVSRVGQELHIVPEHLNLHPEL